MFCTKCGTRIAEAATFCHSCGARAFNPVQETKVEGTQDNVQSSQQPEGPVDRRIDASGESYWIKYRDVYLKSSYEPKWKHVAILPQGTKVVVAEKGPSGMVRVITEDGTERLVEYGGTWQTPYRDAA